jgi:hypothetical protein
MGLRGKYPLFLSDFNETGLLSILKLFSPKNARFIKHIKFCFLDRAFFNYEENNQQNALI